MAKHVPTTPATPARRRPVRAAPAVLDRRHAPAAPVDFQAMAHVTDHRDADLLADLAQLTELRDGLELARRRGKTAYNRALGANCRESVELEAKIASTPAVTSEGRRAKAMHALRDADPDAPCGGFSGFNASAFSALWDIVQAGEL